MAALITYIETLVIADYRYPGPYVGDYVTAVLRSVATGPINQGAALAIQSFMLV